MIHYGPADTQRPTPNKPPRSRNVQQHEPRLRSKRIDTIVLGGFLTNCCVESTMRTGYEHGFRVITMRDCVAATSQEEHDNAIAYDYPMLSLPLTSAEVIAAF
jgi:nicotinamidase-related amidase